MITLKQKFLIFVIITVVLVIVILLIVYLIRRRYNSTQILEYLGNDIPLYSLCSQHTKRCEKPAGSHNCCVDHLATMLEALTEELGSKVFILFGTSLAHKRYNGKHMIPYDDDLDTGILAEDEELLKASIPKLEKKGFVVKLHEENNQRSGPDPSCSDSKNCPVIKYPPYRYYTIKYSKDNNLHVDIALLSSSKFKDGISVLVDAPQKWANTVSTMSIEEARKYKTWIFPRNLILPVKKGNYLGVDVYHPGKIDQYLEYVYGPNYMIPYDRDNNGGSKNPVNRLMKQMPNSDNESIGLGPILIINLDNDKERLHHVFKQCEEEGLYAKKIGNCCERPLTDEENNRFVFNIRRLKTMNTGEKKCFLSHEMCWKEAAKQSLPSLIVEDDVVFPFEFKDILSRIINELKYMIMMGITPKATTIRLGCSTDWTNNIQQIENTCFATGDLNTGAWAYIVTPEAAKELLKISLNNSLKWPSDLMINPPYNRKSSQHYETEMPGIDIYMFLEIYEGAFSSLRKRYNLKTDKDRNQIVQELSTDLNSSRTSQV
jgi:GR25 family glycosyltransferase involved in LPS biosynthesis